MIAAVPAANLEPLARLPSRPLASDVPVGLLHRQRAALDELARTGLPVRRDEAWRYSNPRRLLDHAWTFAVGAPSVALPAHLAALTPRLVFVDGQLALEHCVLAPGLTAREQAAPSAFDARPTAVPDAGFAALAVAWATAGAVIEVAPGATLGPVHLLHLSSAGRSLVSPVHHVVSVGAGASLALVEHHLGLADVPRWSLASVDLFLEADARLAHSVLVDGQASATYLHHAGVVLGDRADYERTALLFGGALLRDEVQARLAGADASVTLRGLALAADGAHVDQHSRVVHAGPRGRATQELRSVVGRAARAIASGLVVVESAGAGADVLQGGHAVLLADDAQVQGRPQLEIHTDQVAARHGATVGRLDPEAMFYLGQRGLDPVQARRLLLASFTGVVLEHLHGPERAIADTLAERLLNA